MMTATANHAAQSSTQGDEAMKNTTRRIAATFAACALSLVLSGCTMGSLSTATAPTHAGGTANVIKGIVHGGQQPVTSASVYLYAAGASGSTSILDTTVAGVQTDGGGNGYVMTDGNGDFNITGDWDTEDLPCPGSTELYLVAVGGNPGGGTNTGAELMVPLGTCSYLHSTSFIWMNERTTVALAWALGSLMSTPTSVTGSVAVLTNSFAMANNLVNTTNGSVSVSGAAADKINALADILAVCLNSTTGSASCSTLSSNSAGSDTSTAAIYMATHPTTNVPTLFGMIPATPVFATGLSSAPSDWTMAISFSGAGSSPAGVKVDGNGNLWVPDSGSNTVTEMTGAGSVVNSYSTGTLSAPVSVYIDGSNNVWVANSGTSTVAELNNSGSILQTCSGNGLLIPNSVTMDAAGNIWVTDSGTSNVSVFTSNCGTFSGSPFSGASSPVGLLAASN